MKILKVTRPQEIRHEAHEAFDMLEGEKIKVEIAGVDVLEAEVPEGVEWEVGIDISIIEKSVT